MIDLYLVRIDSAGVFAATTPLLVLFAELLPLLDLLLELVEVFLDRVGLVIALLTHDESSDVK